MPVWLKTVSKEKEIKIKRKRITIRKSRKLREIETVKNPRAVPTSSVGESPLWESPTEMDSIPFSKGSADTYPP